LQQRHRPLESQVEMAVVAKVGERETVQAHESGRFKPCG
jgi:hypothetical protein